MKHRQTIFNGLKDIIEGLLEEEQSQQEAEADRELLHDNASLWQQDGRQENMERASGGLQLTPVNIALIALNVLIFILVRYVPAFGVMHMLYKQGSPVMVPHHKEWGVLQNCQLHVYSF
jgi:hypothetical protein